jgi:DNA topoisomerase-1
VTILPAASVEALDLHWVDDSVPGITRRRCGKHFSYRDPGGTTIRDAATIARIRSLAIPPAWEQVWICPDPNGHIQATGRDAKGRKQYRYHAKFREHRDTVKYERLYDFGQALPSIRRKVADDMARPTLDRDKVVATVVRLLEGTLVRVGNEEYARTNKSYGLTTLRDRHARFDRNGVRFVFKAKHGIDTRVAINDRRLARVVKACQDLPGQVLFQYVDDGGEPRPVTSTDVNTYLRDAADLPVTAKDFRTWMGTLMAACALASLPAPASETEGRRVLKGVLDVVAANLRNTPAVCRGSYVHPTVIDAYLDGSLSQRWDAGPARATRHLIAEERKLLALLAPPRARRTSRRGSSGARGTTGTGAPARAA